MKKTIVRLITSILAAALIITSIFAVSVTAATKPKSTSSTVTEKTIDYKKALQDLAEGIEARDKILEEDGNLAEAFKAEYEAVADYEEAKYGEGVLLDILANSCVTSLKQIAAIADLTELTQEEQEELQPLIESEIQAYLEAVNLLEKKFDMEVDDYELPAAEKSLDKSKDSAKKTKTDKAAASDQLQPLEIKDSGWTILNNEYLYFYVNLYNPNEEIVVQYPSFRITARDAEGVLLGTKDQTLSVLYPQQEFVYGFQAFKVDGDPEIVEFEVLEPKDYNLKTIDTMEPFDQLEVTNTGIRSDKIVGEIFNPNESDIDMAAVVAICKDAEGNIIDIPTTFTNELKGGSTIPFEIRIRKGSEIAEFEVYANQW